MNAFNTFKIRHLSEQNSMNTMLHTDAKVDANSPALMVVHEFNLLPPNKLEANTSVDDALLIGKKTHAKINFVIDHRERLVGLVSNLQLTSSHVLRTASLSKKSREDITVADVMVPASKLHSVSEFALRSSRVGDVIKTMESAGIEYLLVTDRDPNQVRGYIDLLEISRMVGQAVSVVHRADSFADIVTSLWHHNEI